MPNSSLLLGGSGDKTDEERGSGEGGDILPAATSLSSCLAIAYNTEKALSLTCCFTLPPPIFFLRNELESHFANAQEGKGAVCQAGILVTVLWPRKLLMRGPADRHTVSRTMQGNKGGNKIDLQVNGDLCRKIARRCTV